MKDKIIEIINYLFMSMWGWVIEPFKSLKTLKSWIFGKDGVLESDLVYGTFEKAEITSIFEPGYYTMMAVAGTLFVLAVALHGMRIQGAAINPNSRGVLIEFIKDLLIVTICLFNLPTLLAFVFEVNMAFVKLFEGSFEMQKVSKELGEDSLLGDMVIGLVLLGLSIWANFYYMMRKFTLIILMILSPLMVVFYLFPKFKGITVGWMKEYIGTIFVQAVHAFCYWVMALFASSTATGIETVILYMIFIPVGEGLKSLLGLSTGLQGSWSKAGAMMGMSALAGMAGSVKGALGDQSVTGALKGMYQGIKDKRANKDVGEDGKPTLGGNTGPDTGTTSLAEKMLKAGNITSKMGKATFGMAGSIAGSPMGPVGAMMGATGAAALGEGVGGLTGRTGFAAVAGVKNGIAGRLKKGKEGLEKAKEENGQSAEDEIVSRIADDQTTQWAKQNRDDFMKVMKEKFPDAHKSELEKKWDQKVSDKKKDNIGKARGLLNDLKPLVSSDNVVDKASSNMAAAWGEENKEGFMKEFEKNNPPGKPLDTMSSIEKSEYQNRKNAAWNKKLDDKKSQFKNAAQQVANGIVGVGINNEATNKQAEDMTSKWANENKAGFMKQYAKNNPPGKELYQLSQSEKDAYNRKRDEAWSDKVTQKKSQFTEQARNNNVSSERKGNYAIDGSSFAKNFANKIEGMERAEIRAKNPNASKEEIELEYQNLSNKKKAYAESIGNAANSAEKFAINNGKVNTMGIAQYVAKTNTANQKSSFLEKAVDNGVSPHIAEQQWSQREQEVSKENYNQAQAFVNRPMPSQNSIVKGLKLAGGYAGAASGLSSVVNSAKTIGSNVGLGAVTGWTGAVDPNSTTTIASVGSKVTGAIAGSVMGIGNGYQQLKMDSPSGENPIAAQKAFSDKVGYMGGVMLGTKGYTLGSQLATKINPHNKAVNRQISEPGEVMQMAQKVIGDNGTEQIANGAVRMVTTADESYIQVRTRTGEVQQVSKTGRGDSGLKSGEVVYQDLNVQDGAFVPNVLKGTKTSAYKMDSTGSKVPFNRIINTAPNSLLANNSPIGVQDYSQKQPYNQAVDTGQFNLGDLTKQKLTQNVELVVNREQSYLQATNNGQTYRVSKIAPGDPRLTEEITQKVTVKNHKLIKEDIKVDQTQVKGIEPGQYTSTIDPNELLPPILNKRYINRQNSERGRFKGVSI
jgi:trimeric autotransporter adhesin